MKQELSVILPSKIFETFETMFGMTVRQIKIPSIGFDDDDIIGKAVLQENNTEVQIRFVFARGSLRPLLLKIYDNNTAAHEDVLEDAICEIINIVCAGLKAQLNNDGHKISMASPVIDYSFSKSEDRDRNHLRLNFILDGEKFSIDIAMDEPCIKH